MVVNFLSYRARLGMVRSAEVRFGAAWQGTASQGLAWSGEAGPGVPRLGREWCGAARFRFSTREEMWANAKR